MSIGGENKVGGTRLENLEVNELLTMTITVPATKDVLEARLKAYLAERDRREKCRGLSGCLSDQWLQRDIDILKKAIEGHP